MSKDTTVGFIVACIFLLVGFSKIYAQDATNRKIDSLYNALTTTENDSVKMLIHNQLRRITFYSDSDAAKEHTLKVLDYALKIDDSLYQGLANYYMANSFIKLSDYEEALNYYFAAANIFDTMKDSMRLSAVYNGIGAAYENFGNDSLSLKYFVKYYDINFSMGDFRRSAIALNNISNIYKNRGKLQEALKYSEKAVKQISGTKYQEYINLLSLNLANLYFDLNLLEKSEQIYEKTLPKIDTINNTYGYGIALKGLGNIQLSKNNFVKGLRYLKHADYKFNSSSFSEESFKLLPDLVKAYELNKKYKQAILLFKEYNRIKDSIFNTAKDKNLSDALQKYETKKKDLEIAQQIIEIEKKENQKVQLIVGLVSLGIVLLLSGFFFWKRIQYQKTITEKTNALHIQKVIELQQQNKLLALNSMIEGQEVERMRIAKDLHDGLGGLLSTVKAHFSAIQNEVTKLERLNLAEKTNELIDEACVEVRRISHDMIPHALTLSGLPAVLEDRAETLVSEGFKVDLDIQEFPEDMVRTRQAMLFRLIQEIISNIRKHANAKNILIQILGNDRGLSLIVEDDGDGFDYRMAMKSGGVGLKSINSRVEFLNGTIDWDSSLGKGTTITVNVPEV